MLLPHVPWSLSSPGQCSQAAFSTVILQMRFDRQACPDPEAASFSKELQGHAAPQPALNLSHKLANPYI